MTVFDASVLADALADDGAEGSLARDELKNAESACAPDLADAETASVLRRFWLTGALTDARFDAAITSLQDLPIERFPALPLLRRACELKANVTVYDGIYVALAELLQCAFVTVDARLASAPGIDCPIILLSE